MSDRFTYTAKDADGCILETPDYAECKNCILDYKEEGQLHKCIVYPDTKPDEICFKHGKCEYKRTE